MTMISDAEIVKRKCDLSKPFIFFSYSHKEIEFVRKVFVELYDKGYNIWLDGAMLRHDGESWDASAMAAILNPNCKMFFFFRSESSLKSVPCSNEVAKARDENERAYGKIQSPCIDVWVKKGLNAAKALEEFENEDKLTCEKICRYISTEANALRFTEDCKEDIGVLLDKMELVIQEEESLKDEPISVVNEVETKLDWHQNIWKTVNYWRGGVEVYLENEELDESVFAGYTPTIAVKKYKTEKGSVGILFFHYANEEEGYEETLACVIDSDISVEDFVLKLDAAIYEKVSKCADLECDPGFYMDDILDGVIEENLEVCSRDNSDYNARRFDFEVHNVKSIFDKYFINKEIQGDIENTLKIFANYNIARDEYGYYMTWTY